MLPLSQSSPLAIQSPFKAQLAMGLVIFAACLIGIALRPIGYLSIFWPANQLLLFMLLRYAHVLLRPSGLAVSETVADRPLPPLIVPLSPIWPPLSP